MVGGKKSSGVGLGTGTKSIIIAVRITPALHTEKSSLSLSLSLYRSVSHSPPLPPKIVSAGDCGRVTNSNIFSTPLIHFSGRLRARRWHVCSTGQREEGDGS